MKRENELRVGSRKKRPDKDEEERRIQKAFREVAQKAKIAINCLQEQVKVYIFRIW